MCQIAAAEFIYNGGSVSTPCLAHSLDPNGTVNVQAGVTFSTLDILSGRQFKCGLKFRMPSGGTYEFVTPLRTVSSTETFTSDTFTKPIPAGQYDIDWITIYDNYGNTICGGLPASYGCQSISIGTVTSYNITFIAGAGGQIHVFKNGTDLGSFKGTKTITAYNGDDISVWCDADTGYTFTKLCTPDNTCTTTRPFDFKANMDISMTATFDPVIACQPPNGVQRYCEADGKTICVWNQVACKYDCSICTTNVCQNGICTNPSGGIGYNCSGSPNYQCTQAPTGQTGQYYTTTECADVCKSSGGVTTCTPKPGEICLPGIGPIQTVYLIGAGAGIIVIMLMKGR